MDRREFLRMLGLAPAVPAVLALPMPGLVPTKPLDRPDWRPFPASIGDYISPKLFETYASELFTEVCSRLQMARRITMDYEDHSMRQGSTVNIPVHPTLVSKRLEDEPYLTWGNIPITLKHHIEATNQIAVRDLTDAEKRKRSMFPMALNLAERIDQDILDLRCEFYANRPLRVRDHVLPSDALIDAVHERLWKARVPIHEQKYLVVDDDHFNDLRLKERAVYHSPGRLSYKGVEIFKAPPMHYRKLQLAFTPKAMVCIVRKLDLPEAWALYPNRGPYDMMYAANRESHKLGFGMRVLGIQSPRPGLHANGDFLMIHAEVLYGVGVLREEHAVQVIA